MPCSSDPARLRIVLDLDDTLYLERDYVLSGIDAVGAWVGARFGIDGFAGVARLLFLQGRRGDIFDAAFAMLGIATTPALVARTVYEYRRHRPAIELAADAESFLERAGGRPLAVITDGSALAQRMKVAALGLRRHYGLPVHYTDDWGRAFWKPHVRAFQAAERALGDGAFVYVADNPAKDFIAPRALGWHTIRIARPERIHQAVAETAPADRIIASLDELDDSLLAALAERPAAMRAG